MCKVSIRFVVHPGQAKQRREAKCWGKAQRKENEAPCFSVRLFISRRGGRDGRARRGEAGDNTHARTQRTEHTQHAAAGAAGSPGAELPAGRGGGAEGRDSERHSGRPGNIATHTHARTHAQSGPHARAHGPAEDLGAQTRNGHARMHERTRTTYRQTIHARTHARTRGQWQSKKHVAEQREKRRGRGDTKKKTGIPGAQRAEGTLHGRQGG